MQYLRTGIHNKPSSHFGAFSNKCTKGKKLHLKSDAITYLFGFNGQERDDEVAGVGNITTADFWEYDARLGRRWNLDPVTKPWMSSFHTFSNTPILNIDPSGANDDEYKVDIETGEKTWVSNKGGDDIDIIHYGSYLKSGEQKGGFVASRMEMVDKTGFLPTSFNYNRNGDGSFTPREYRTSGFSDEQNRAVVNLMLSASIGVMTGGIGGFIGGSGGSMAMDATSQLVANNFDYKKINITSVILSGVLPPTLKGQAWKNLISSGATISLGGETLIYGVDHSDLSYVLTLATIGLAFDRGGEYFESMSKVNSPYLTRLQSLNYKPKVALELTRYETRLGVGGFFSSTRGKIGLGATGNALQNIAAPEK